VILLMPNKHAGGRQETSIIYKGFHYFFRDIGTALYRESPGTEPVLLKVAMNWSFLCRYLHGPIHVYSLSVIHIGRIDRASNITDLIVDCFLENIVTYNCRGCARVLIELRT